MRNNIYLHVSNAGRGFDKTEQVPPMPHSKTAIMLAWTGMYFRIQCMYINFQYSVTGQENNKFVITLHRKGL